MKKQISLLWLAGFAAVCVSACAPSGSLNTINISASGPPETAFTIHDVSQLIGGPLATGRIGDVLLENDKIRLIIEQPGKTPWVGNFGGGIVDADLVRSGSAGQDNFGYMHPLINFEWTVNVFDFEVVDAGEDGGEKIFRTYGMIDVYDYLDIDFISPVAKALTDQTLYFAPRFDDVNDPFNLTGLRNLSTIVVTDYTLKPGKNYVRIDTTFENVGGEDVYVPVGEFVNGSGEVMFLIPGLGFTPEMMPQIQGDTPALIYVGFEDSGVSYGYFYDLRQFVKTSDDGMEERLKSTSLSYSGVTGILLGEDFLKVLPLGNQTEPKINFSVPAHGTRTITRYFVVGNGSGGSVFDAGLSALGISTDTVSGVVADSAGLPVAGATVAVKNESDATVTTYRTDSEGKFSGLVSTGQSQFDKAFGSGKYKFSAYKKGYKINGSTTFGICDPEEINVAMGPADGIRCELGKSSLVQLVGGVVDEDSGQNIPARMTVVGYIPTYRSETGGHFEDKIIFERPLGVVDVFYVNANGTIGLDERQSIRLAPGSYELVFTRGIEYSMQKIPVKISGDAAVTIGPVSLKKVVNTSGYISADFHLHSIVSPDSAMRPERRVLAAAGEGMNVLQSSDHDYLVDYGLYMAELAGRGIVKAGSMTTIVGDEISPNHLGHLNAFPLEYKENKPGGGALDWGRTELDIAGPDPDFVMSPKEIVEHLRSLPEDPVIQINHIADAATSVLTLGGWVTTPYYFESHGVSPLSSFSDPVLNRLRPRTSAANFPYPYGQSDFVVTDVDAIELNIGPWLHDDFLLTSSLPEWFNLLNLGVILTATGNSDSHREIANPVGAPRNFIVSNIDPADGLGSFGDFDVRDYVESIRNHKVIVSAGPFVKTFAKNDRGYVVSVGEVIKGNEIEFSIDVVSPEWAWFDTIEIYVNTEPIPAGDDGYKPAEGKASDPAEFFASYHVRRYYYEPAYTFSLKDKTLENWKNEDGVIRAKVEIDIVLEKDAWIVVFVRGTEETEGYRSLFPYVTRALVDADNPSAEPVEAELGNVDMLSLTGAPAWAFTNPIFVDVDGDGFHALYSNDWSFEGNSATHLTHKASPQRPVILSVAKNPLSIVIPAKAGLPAGRQESSVKIRKTSIKSAIHTNSELLK